MESPFAIKRTFEINRTIAIKVVNIYYEIKNEANHKEDMKQFKKNFEKFIVSYMNNTYFTEQIAESLFMSIATLEDETEESCVMNQWKCENYYKFSYKEVGHLFLSVKNYHYLNDIKNNHFETTDEMMNIMIECDWEIEENDCCICKWHGYDMDWPNSAERGKFYYCIPGNINNPVCESCVKTKYLHINTSREDEEEYGSVAYLEKHNLIKCNNCGNIWDGCAQCNCWTFQDYLETPLDLYQVDNVEKNKPANDLVICDMCGNMWDGDAQCKCWYYSNCLTHTIENEDTYSAPMPAPMPEPMPEKIFIRRFPRPTKPLPVPPILLAPILLAPSVDEMDKKIKDLAQQNKMLVEQNKELSEQNKELLDELTRLKQKIDKKFYVL